MTGHRASSAQVVRAGEETARVTVDPGDPVFPGHYPGYPVLPGVYLIEFADVAVRDRLGDAPGVRLAGVDKCRFLSPVYAGDEVTLELTRVGNDDDGGGLRYAVRAGTERGPAAAITLSYRREPSDDRA